MGKAKANEPLEAQKIIKAEGQSIIKAEGKSIIKVEGQNILDASFIYLVPLMEWDFNLAMVTKIQGIIRVCVDYMELNLAFPKDNYLTFSLFGF